jgi:hypothetical protein
MVVLLADTIDLSRRKQTSGIIEVIISSDHPFSTYVGKIGTLLQECCGLLLDFFSSREF